jgi:hypothetical protein
MAMAKKRSEEKERYWRAVLQRQARSGVSIAKFCRSEGVSEPSFYSWKRRILAGGKERKVTNPKRSETRRAPAETSGTSPGFVPVQITEERRPVTIQVVWPTGLSVQVPAECDPAEVQAVLQMVDGLARQG